MSPFQVVKDFEQALCEYTGAPYAVAVNSCTMALLLAVKYCIDHSYYHSVGLPVVVEIPKRTYVSVPMSIMHAGGEVAFRDEKWSGLYQLSPLPVWDCARFFTSDMYHSSERLAPLNERTMMCVSFHTTKILGDTQGGAILHSNPEADAWFRRMRFDGRTEGVAPKDDNFTEIGYHCYMSPDVAARLLHKLSVLPNYNAPLPNSDYPDLSTLEIFK
jgi:dTDP-4-amino-4,6-dideoxygalactose transaminase